MTSVATVDTMLECTQAILSRDFVLSCIVVSKLFFVIQLMFFCFCFSALTLLIGRQEWHLA